MFLIVVFKICACIKFLYLTKSLKSAIGRGARAAVLMIYLIQCNYLAEDSSVLAEDEIGSISALNNRVIS